MGSPARLSPIQAPPFQLCQLCSFSHPKTYVPSQSQRCPGEGVGGEAGDHPRGSRERSPGTPTRGPQHRRVQDPGGRQPGASPCICFAVGSRAACSKPFSPLRSWAVRPPRAGRAGSCSPVRLRLCKPKQMDPKMPFAPIRIPTTHPFSPATAAAAWGDAKMGPVITLGLLLLILMTFLPFFSG